MLLCVCFQLSIVAKNIPDQFNDKGMLKIHFMKFGKITRLFHSANKNGAVITYADRVSSGFIASLSSLTLSSSASRRKHTSLLSNRVVPKRTIMFLKETWLSECLFRIQGAIFWPLQTCPRNDHFRLCHEFSPLPRMTRCVEPARMFVFFPAICRKGNDQREGHQERGAANVAVLEISNACEEIFSRANFPTAFCAQCRIE